MINTQEEDNTERDVDKRETESSTSILSLQIEDNEEEKAFN